MLLHSHGGGNQLLLSGDENLLVDGLDSLQETVLSQNADVVLDGQEGVTKVVLLQDTKVRESVMSSITLVTTA